MKPKKTKTKGKFIVIYGINNLGKSVQAKKLVRRLRSLGKKAEYIKYARYDLVPSGPLLDEYLRKGNPYRFSAREFQMIHALNKTQFEKILQKKLTNGTWVVAEDYVGTSLAWGMGAGVEENLLTLLNQHLIREDFAILLDGERFQNAAEKNHTHETNNALIKRVRKVHLTLAKKYGWHVVNANQTIEQVHEEIWKIVRTRL